MCVCVCVDYEHVSISSSTAAATCVAASWWHSGVYDWWIINNAVSRMPTLPNLTCTQNLACIIKCIRRPILEPLKIEKGRQKISVSSALLCYLKRVCLSFFPLILYSVNWKAFSYTKNVSRPWRLNKMRLGMLFFLCLFMPKPLTSKVLLSFIIYLFFQLFHYASRGVWRLFQGGRSIQLPFYLKWEQHLSGGFSLIFRRRCHVSCKQLWHPFSRVGLSSASAGMKI